MWHVHVVRISEAGVPEQLKTDGPQSNEAAFAGMTCAWFVALASTLGALFIGEVMGQMPCVTCWYQRIAMFPIVIILGVGLLRDDDSAWIYAMPLALTGGAIALWHSLLYAEIIPKPIVPCTANGSVMFRCRTIVVRYNADPLSGALSFHPDLGFTRAKSFGKVTFMDRRSIVLTAGALAIAAFAAGSWFYQAPPEPSRGPEVASTKSPAATLAKPLAKTSTKSSEPLHRNVFWRGHISSPIRQSLVPLMRQ